MKILVIGDRCVDKYVYTNSTRLSPEAPVPVLTPVKTVSNSGMAGNVWENLVALGATVDIVSNTSYITKTRFVDEHTNQMFIRFDENDVSEEIGDRLHNITLDDYDAIVISDYNKGFLSENDIFYITSNHNLTFMDTKKKLGSWALGTTYIKLNAHEYANSDLESMSNVQRDILNEKLIVTLGRDGCEFNGNLYPVGPVEIKDLSGAGDTFIAGLVVKYLETKNIDEALTFANKCSTIVVQKRGVCTI